MATVAGLPSGKHESAAVFRPAYGQRYRLVILGLLGLALLAAGGASRADEDQQMLVRLAAILAIAATLWPLEFERLRSHRRWLAGAAAAYALLIAQLVPLPHDLWAQLPGHGPYARIAQEGGVVVWRPLSLTPDLTLNSVLHLLPATAAGLAALHVHSRGRRQLALWIVAAAMFSTLMGFVQLGAGGDAAHLFRESSDASAVGLFANRNHQAALLACALPLVGAIAGLRLREGGIQSLAAAAALLTAGLLLLGMIATGSRMGLVLGLLGVLGALLSYRASGLPLIPSERRSRVALLAACTALFAATVLATVRLGIVDRLAVIDTVSESRMAMLDPLLRTARALLPLGSGFGSFNDVYRQFEPEDLLSTIYMNHAHNEPLQLAIEGGVPALILLALFLWWWTKTTLRIVRAGLPVVRRVPAMAAVAITLILMASSLVDYPLRTPLLGAIFVVACVEMMRAVAPRS